LLGVALHAALFTSAAALFGCNQQPAAVSTSAPAGSSTAAAIAPPSPMAQQATSYVPPTADQLYQLVAPIALFPDKLVAQVLAGSTYPEQVSAADSFLEQNQSLQGSALQDAVNPQSWDPSIKGLTVFPKVLDQMAQNIPWTTALGNAYANDPTDVLNAIQVMRQRASSHGSLRNSAKLRVVNQPAAAVDASYVAAPDQAYEQDTYNGPDVVPPPQQTIEILPADSNTVYVPEYDPETVYGNDMQAYPSYRYDRSGYSTGDMVATGAIAFGAGIVIASLFEHQHRDQPNYGWNSWGMQWHGDDRDRGFRGNQDNAGRWQRPAVVHNNTVYVSRSTTINNRYVTNNINNSVINSNNRSNHSNNRSNNGNTWNRPYPAPQAAGGNPALRSVPMMPVAGASNRLPTVTHANLPSAQAMRRPDFTGALTKGVPARFAHPQQTQDRPSVAAPIPGRSPESLRQTRVDRPEISAASAGTRVPANLPRAPLAQPSHAERVGSVPVRNRHIGTAATMRSQAAANVQTPEPRPFQRNTPPVPHPTAMPRPQATVAHRDIPRPSAPPQQAPRPAPENRAALATHAAAPQPYQAPRQQMQSVRMAARPQPPQIHAVARTQMPPRQAAAQHQGAPPSKGNKHPKKDDNNH